MPVIFKILKYNNYFHENASKFAFVKLEKFARGFSRCLSQQFIITRLTYTTSQSNQDFYPLKATDLTKGDIVLNDQFMFSELVQCFLIIIWKPEFSQ